MTFNGVRIARGMNRDIRMDQPEKIDKITVPANENVIASKRAMEKYVGVNFRPDICAAVQMIAPGGVKVTK